MIFHHFTNRDRLDSIMQNGLITGDVPITPTGPGLNGVWLTNDNDHRGHGLSDGGVMSEEAREVFKDWKGVYPPVGAAFRNKREIKISIKIPMTDRQLKHWVKWSQGRVSDQFRNGLIEAGGGMRKAKTWFVYFGVIPTSLFTRVVDLIEQKETQRAVNDINRRLPY